MIPTFVTVVIPVYGNRHATEACITSCLKYIHSPHSILIVNDASPDAEMENMILGLTAEKQNVRYVRNHQNLGFVQTCNKAVDELENTENDILLLNADTVVTEGFLEEMHACLTANERHGVCCPRSDNATIFSIPGPDSFVRWKTLRDRMPRYTVVPTGVGFCMLIRRTLIREYGLFDEAYGEGYNEENDFCYRINRHGYSVVMANRAFVFHCGGQSFSPQKKIALEERNGTLLRTRYAEYQRAIDDYTHWYQNAATQFAALLDDDHRPSIAIDLSHLPAAHNGTTEYVFRLLEHLVALLKNHCDVWIIVNSRHSFFAPVRNMARTLSPKESEQHSFDLVFVPHQIFGTYHITRLNRISPRIVVTMHDDIALRCQYLHTTEMEYAFRLTMRWADGIIAISGSSLANIAAYAEGYGSHLPKNRVILHGVDQMPSARDTTPHIQLPERFILVLGNAFAHKRIRETLDALPDDLPIILLGKHNSLRGSARILQSGNLPPHNIEELYKRCAFVVFPSAYEGFGLPVLHAVRHGKIILVANLPIFQEIEDAFHASAFLRHFGTLAEMRKMVLELWHNPQPPLPPLRITRGWKECAAETASFLQEILLQPVRQDIEERFSQLRFIEAARGNIPRESMARKIHRHVGHGLDRWPALKLFIRKVLPFV